MLKAKQIELISNILQCASLAEAIERTGISANTAYKWHSSDQEFKEELNKRKLQILSSVTSYLQASLITCSEKLMQIINDDVVAPQIKINAISVVFQNARAMTEQTDFLERLVALEENQKVLDNE